MLKGIARAESSKVKNIREIMDISSSEFSVNRERLIEKGLINGSEYGVVKFALPRFGEFSLRIRE